MAENPESLNSQVERNNGSSNAVDALHRQVQMHTEADLNKTVLDKMVEVVWHKDDQTLNDLRTLQTKVDADLKKGDNASVTKMGDQIKGAVSADQKAMQSQNTVEYYGTGFLKAVPLFAGKARVMMAASIAINALDAVHVKDSGNEVAADLALGGLKGFALKQTFDVLGPKQLGLGAEGSALAGRTSIAGVGLKGVALGGLSRAYDTGLNRQNWVDGKGDIAPGQAGAAALGAALDGRSMVMDATLFMGAHGFLSGAGKLATSAIEASPALQKIESSAAGAFVKQSNMLPGATMGATFGFSSGAVGEYSRERQAGESLDLGKIVKNAALQSLSDAAAGATGAGATRLTALNYNPTANLARAVENTSPASRLGTVFAGDDIVPPSHPAHVEAQPEGHNEAHPETPVEKPAAAHVEAAAAPEATATSDANAGHITTDRALVPLFERSVHLAHNAVKPGATPEDVISYIKYAAGDGQHVKAEMTEVAEQAKNLDNPQLEALIRYGFQVTPEVAATLDTGLRLAEQAGRHGATPEHDLAFLTYAYGEGRQAEIPLRVAAELAGNDALDHRLQEAYAGANQLGRTDAQVSRLDLSHIPEGHIPILAKMLNNLPVDASQHQDFRDNVRTWANLSPAHADVLHQYGPMASEGVVAAVFDTNLGSNYLSRFPDRSLTGADLLGKLRNFDSRRAAGDAPGDGIAAPPDHNLDHNQNDVVPPAAGQELDRSGSPAGADQVTVQAPVANPYEPAIEHLTNGKKIVNAEKLYEEFETSEGRAKQARAYLLSDFIGKMSDQQFVNWYANGLEPANRADTPAGTTNFDLMHMQGVDVLKRPEVISALSDPANAAIDARTLKDFLSTPPKGGETPPSWQTSFIADRVELATHRAAMAHSIAVEAGLEPPAPDPSKVVKEAVPSWFLKSMRDRFSTFDRASGTAIYPMEFNDHLAQMLENQRYVEMQNPKYRESTPPSNGFPDRIALLEKALDLQKTTASPEVVPQILKLGAGDQTAVRGVLDKLDLTTNAPEYTELLKLTLPHAENIQDVKTLLDAIYFGKKADSNAFKAKKNDKPADFAEKDRDANSALALATARRLTEPGSLEAKRVEKIISEIITGKIRDPRPDFDGPGGPGGPGGKPGGRDFRQRPGTPRDDRPPREGGRPVAAENVTPQAAAPQVEAAQRQEVRQEVRQEQPQQTQQEQLSFGLDQVPDHQPQPLSDLAAPPAQDTAPSAPETLARETGRTGHDTSGGADNLTESSYTEPAPSRRAPSAPVSHDVDYLEPHSGKPQGRKFRDGGHKERGGAKSNRYNKDLDDDWN